MNYWDWKGKESENVSHSVVSNSLWPHGLQHTRLLCPLPSPWVFFLTHVHWVSGAIQPSYPLSPLSPPALNLAQHQDLFQWISSLASVAKVWPSASASVLPMNIQGWISLRLTGLISLQSKGLSRVFSNTTVQSINSLALSLLYGLTLTSVHDCWKKHSFWLHGPLSAKWCLCFLVSCLGWS